MSLFEDRLGRRSVRRLARPSTLAFDPVNRRLAAVTRTALVAAARVDGRELRGAARRTRLARLGLRDPRGLTFDPATRSWYILDARARTIIRLAVRKGSVRAVGRTSLAGVGLGRLRGLAFNPADRLLYVMSPDRGLLFGLDRAGTVRRAYGLEALQLENPQALVFAPSADPTDEPSTRHLYVVDAGRPPGAGAIVEAGFAAPRTFAAAVEQVDGALVRMIETSRYSPPSPDPAGIAYIAAADRLLVSDSEVNEMTLYQGSNLFTATRTGSGTGTGTTLAFSKEPTGLGYNPTNGTLFVSDDDADRISVVRPGPDGRHGTSDDVWTRFSTAAFGSMDAEGVEYDTSSGHVFVCDGIALDVFDVDPVNGVFGDGNDVVSRFDIGQYGARDCEGLGLDPQRGTLLALDPSSKRMYEVTKAGALVRVVDLSKLPTLNRAFAGVTVAPTSDPNDHPAKTNYWIVDRQRDNGGDPTENDGLLYEVSVPTPSLEPTVAVTSPADGSIVAGDVSVEATAIGGTTFTSVEFFVGDTSIGIDTNGGNGWSVSWATRGFPDGGHVVTAAATGANGAVTRDSNAVTVDNRPPSVALTAPAPGSTVAGTIRVEAAASDNTAITSVQFFADGASIGTDTSGADGWSVSWDTTDLANGSHGVGAVARDAAGNTTTSATVGVVVDNPAVAVLDRPIAAGVDDAEEVEGGSVSRTKGDIELGTDAGVRTTVGLRFTTVGVPNGANVLEAWVQFQVDERGRDASTLTVQAERSDSAASFTSTAFNISSRPRTSASASWSPPQWLTVGEAGPGQRTADISSVVQEVVNRPGWSSGNALAVLITGSGRRTAESFEGGAPPVLHVAYSTGSASQSQPDAPPQVTIVSPAAGAVVSGSVNVTAAASDDRAVASVRFFVDGAHIGTDANGVDGWSSAWDTSRVANGNHGVAAVAVDSAGNETTSATVGVVVDNPSVVVLNVRVAAGVDDADELASGSVSRTKGDLELGTDAGVSTTVGLRFAAVGIPKRVTIHEAWVQFQVDELGRDTSSLTVWGERSDNAASFTSTAFNISSRPRTSASASWSPPQWLTVGEAGPGQRTADVSSVVQEVVNRPGWSSGNALAVLITGSGRRTAESFEGGAPPVLHVAYSALP